MEKTIARFCLDNQLNITSSCEAVGREYYSESIELIKSVKERLRTLELFKTSSKPYKIDLSTSEYIGKVNIGFEIYSTKYLGFDYTYSYIKFDPFIVATCNFIIDNKALARMYEIYKKHVYKKYYGVIEEVKKVLKSIGLLSMTIALSKMSTIFITSMWINLEDFKLNIGLREKGNVNEFYIEAEPIRYYDELSVKRVLVNVSKIFNMLSAIARDFYSFYKVTGGDIVVKSTYNK